MAAERFIPVLGTNSRQKRMNSVLQGIPFLLCFIFISLVLLESYSSDTGEQFILFSLIAKQTLEVFLGTGFARGFAGIFTGVVVWHDIDIMKWRRPSFLSQNLQQIQNTD
ncbi:hypothetical protein AVEN_56560-1 [Araneus ventricosus]|uniref:Uncharacterized protein n=1 Tax=Araneus ventricosus TaxID=182803 RepID=A0A4Y2HGY2_ARAVE|nr:hypothetical protein AVEN_56560-1 [Araneus ventricosus]